ncbi:hemerythrin domain-containing protein [Variovorax sp. PBL-E5]|uniref:hemerythrin domain-containing protein n=1 Tax=Variovorax sp. PBL-E5 TaxID=434014 RepID=UPI0013189F05|nr:hemerythrin domain-containing protein [Variovorax sp. PBL-E5]VTU27248.1 hypothetical protein E5CHR_02360 [Variovorax sp. PBL-E5]
MPSFQPFAVQLIREDHEALATVLGALRNAVERVGRSGQAPDFDELRAMLFYLDEMPARMHHASESELLFPKIRERCPALHPVLDRLEAEHERCDCAVRELAHALTAWEVMGEVHRESFQLLLHAHGTLYLGHMEVEESYVLPVAADYLSPADWRELAEALAHQRNDTDPSMTQGHRALFARIKAHPSLQK